MLAAPAEKLVCTQSNGRRPGSSVSLNPSTCCKLYLSQELSSSAFAVFMSARWQLASECLTACMRRRGSKQSVLIAGERVDNDYDDHLRQWPLGCNLLLASSLAFSHSAKSADRCKEANENKFLLKLQLLLYLSFFHLLILTHSLAVDEFRSTIVAFVICFASKCYKDPRLRKHFHFHFKFYLLLSAV